MNFNYLPQRRGSEKLQKRGWKYGTRAWLLKIEGRDLPFFYLIFSGFINQKFLKLLYKVIISCRMQPTSANISSKHLVHPVADEDFVICWNAHEGKCSCCQADVWCLLQLLMTLLNYFTLCKIVLCVWRKKIFLPP